MKKTICLVAVFTLLTVSAFAQRGAINRSQLGDNGSKNGNPATPPTYCNPCLFYGGDWDPNSSWVAYFNGTNTAGYDASVYVPFTVPSGQQWKVNGMFTNNLALNIDKTDPNKAPYDIRSGVSEGNGGTSVASGSANAKFSATGRNYQNTYFEYTEQVKLSSPVSLAAGSYWMAVTPQCTNNSDSACSSAFYYINDTIGGANRVGPPEPANQSYHNGAVFGFNYTNVCNEGYPPPACSRMSAGLSGKKLHAN